MKKIIQTLTLALFLAVTSFTVKAQSASDNSLIGKARAAAHDCLQQYAGMDINASVQTTGICFAGGTTSRVTFSAGPRCSGNGPCPYFMVLAATVDFDCEGNVISVNCNN